MKIKFELEERDCWRMTPACLICQKDRPDSAAYCSLTLAPDDMIPEIRRVLEMFIFGKLILK